MRCIESLGSRAPAHLAVFLLLVASGCRPDEWSKGTSLEKMQGLHDLETRNAAGELFITAGGIFIVGSELFQKHDFRGAHDAWVQALAGFRALGLRENTAYTLKFLGEADWALGEYARARDYYQSALAIFRELGLDNDMWQTLHRLGQVAAELGDSTQAQAYSLLLQPHYEEALATFRKLGQEKEVAETQLLLADVAYALKEYAQAGACYEKALAMFRALGLEEQAAATLTNLGKVAWLLNRQARARADYEQALATYRKLGHEWEAAEVLKNLSALGLGSGLRRPGPVGLPHADERIDGLIKAKAWDDIVAIGKPAIGPLIAELRKHEKSTAAYFTIEEFAYTMAVSVVLGRMGGDAVEPLTKVLENGGDYLTRSGAAIALGQIGDPRAVEALQKALGDPEPGVVVAARGALEQINRNPKPPAKGR